MMEGPAQLNKAASAAYQLLTEAEKECLKENQPEKIITRKKMIGRSNKIFSQMQKTVGCGIHKLLLALIMKYTFE